MVMALYLSRRRAPHIPLSSPGLTGRSSTPRLHGSSRTAAAYWIPAPVRNCALGGDDSYIWADTVF
ncbi:hypothetical protein ABIE73_004802 [Bradyrhizobium yuanmingense]